MLSLSDVKTNYAVIIKAMEGDIRIDFLYVYVINNVRHDKK